MYGEDDLLALSGLQHMAFCERQWCLIHLEQSWTENADTLRGQYFHERVDTAGYSSARGVRSERGVRLVSRHLGLYGVADIVEFGGGGHPASVMPVEYKVGKPKIQDWDRIQLTAQAMCLEEMYDVGISEAALFYGETRRRERVVLGEALRTSVVKLAARMHELYESGMTVLSEYAPRCRRCSLVDSCLPEALSLDVGRYWRDFDSFLEA